MNDVTQKSEEELAGLFIRYAQTVRTRKRLESDEATMERRMVELEATIKQARQMTQQDSGLVIPEGPKD